MNVDPLTLNLQHTDMLDPQQEAATQVVARAENLHEIWEAAEALTSTDLEARWMGVKRLVELDAPRSYPLVAYLLATRVTETDMELRARVVEALSNIFTLGGLQVNVYTSLVAYLSSMRTRQIYALIQVPIFDTNAEPLVASLLSYCSYAGEHLGEIAADRDTPIEIRWQAVHFIGRLGFLDALPVLERLSARLELKLNGRAGEVERFDEANLLLLMRQVVDGLKAP